MKGNSRDYSVQLLLWFWLGFFEGNIRTGELQPKKTTTRSLICWRWLETKTGLLFSTFHPEENKSSHLILLQPDHIISSQTKENQSYGGYCSRWSIYLGTINEPDMWWSNKAPLLGFVLVSLECRSADFSFFKILALFARSSGMSVCPRWVAVGSRQEAHLVQLHRRLVSVVDSLLYLSRGRYRK